MSKDQTSTEELVEQAVVENLAPEGMIYVPETYHFRAMDKTEKNVAKIPEGAEVDELELEDEAGIKTGVVKIKRKMESVNLLMPLVSMLGVIQSVGDGPDKQSVVLQHLMKEAVSVIGRGLVNVGTAITDVNCNWDIAVAELYDSISSTGSSKGSSISKELLELVVVLFSKYSKDIGKPEKGTEATVKMIKGRFNRMSCRKYLVALPAIQSNIETWFVEGLDEEQQGELSDVTEYLIERIAVAQEPEEEINVGDLF